jgi:hypothetical protein
MDLTQEQVQEAVKQLILNGGTTQQKVAASGTPSTPYMHGAGGLFGVEGIDRDLIHTRIAGNGLAATLPVNPSQYTHPLFGYITGFTDVTGTVPTNVCDDPEIAGQMKTCLQTAPFGRYSFQTREVELNRIGQLISRGEFNDLRLLNDPIAPLLGRTIFPQLSGNAQLSAGAEVLARMLELGVAFANRLGVQTWTGNPVNNSAGGGYEEFMGLDLLIGTNKVDAITGQECPSLDSDIKDMNYELVDSAAGNIVGIITTLFRFVNHIANNTGLNPARWVLVMRTNLFYELTDVWSCLYFSYRCQVFDTANIDPVPQFDAADATNLRDAMREGNYLLIDGVRVPVIRDDFIVEETEGDAALLGPGQFASDIYLVPLTAMGGTPVTFFQHFDYRAGVTQAIIQGRLSAHYWTDGGMYLWNWEKNNWCVVWESKIEPRIILRTPQIAGRITNVAYEPLQHFRDILPGDPYHVDGGVTERGGPSLWADWNDPN